MSIVITGATGQLGGHVLQALPERNVPAEENVAIGRSIGKPADFAEGGDLPTLIDRPPRRPKPCARQSPPRS